MSTELFGPVLRPHKFTPAELAGLIEHDPNLSNAEKQEVKNNLQNNEFFTHIMNGASGASKNAQVLLTMAGFGIGRYLLDNSRKHDKFLEYDNKKKNYKINS
jgi:hypothetical protein